MGEGLFRAEGDLAGPRSTDDADPRHVYHNVAIAIDPARNLYNGQPGLIARWLNALPVGPGERFDLGAPVVEVAVAAVHEDNGRSLVPG